MSYRSVFKAGTAIASLAMASVIVSPATAQDADESDFGVIEEVVVTGSYVRRKSQANSPSPIQVIGQEDIRSLGANDFADIVQTLTSNAGAQNNPDAFTQNLTTGTENINLRGLGVASTLVLLNGKRQVGYAAPTDGGVNFVDLASLVPQIAVERLEVLEDGAAALYGSDAVAGVANFITRSDFEGFEIRGGWQGTTDDNANDFKVEAIWGASTDRANLVISAGYLDRSQLTTRERDLRPAEFTGPNGLSVSTQTASPGNIVVPALATNPALTVTNPGLVGAFVQAYDNFTPFVDPVNGILNIDPATGQFLGFVPGNDLIADGFTSAALAGVVPDSILSQIAAAEAGQVASGAASFQTPFFADPDCGPAAALDDRVVPAFDTVLGQNVGLCQYDFNDDFNLIPDETRLQAFAEFQYDISDNVEFYSEFGFSRNRTTRQTSNFPITSALPVSADYPFNPFGVDVFYVGRSPGRNQINDFYTDNPNPNTIDADTYRLNAGLRGDLTDRWYYDVSYTRAASDYLLTSSDGLRNETLLALSGLGGSECNTATGVPGIGNCQFYNIFGSGATSSPGETVSYTAPNGETVELPVLNSAEILDYINGEIAFNSQSDLTVVEGVVSGDLFELNGRAVGVAVGAQYRDERFAQDLDENTNRGNYLFVTSPTLDFDQSRDVYAIFGELAVPVLENLDLSLALRYEDYGGFVGDTLDPKVAILFTPIDEITLRGSFSTSFRAPSVFQQFGSQTTLNSVLDPRTGGEPFIAITSQGNQDLQPEESDAYNFGITLEPIEGLTLDFDYWRFEFSDVIIRESADELARRALLPSDPAFDPTLLGTRVFLGPTGGLSSITQFFINAAQIDTDGFDFRSRYQFDTDVGIFQLGLEGTYVLNYKAPVGPGGAIVDVVDQRNGLNFTDPVPDLRMNASAAWLYDAHSAFVYVRYTDSYADDGDCIAADGSRVRPNGVTCPAGAENATIGSHTTVDVQYSYTFEDVGPASNLTLTVGAINLFDNNPPFVNTDGGYDSRTVDPRGRLAYIRLRAGF